MKTTILLRSIAAITTAAALLALILSIRAPARAISPNSTITFLGTGTAGGTCASSQVGIQVIGTANLSDAQCLGGFDCWGFRLLDGNGNVLYEFSNGNQVGAPLTPTTFSVPLKGITARPLTIQLVDMPYIATPVAGGMVSSASIDPACIPALVGVCGSLPLVGSSACGSGGSTPVPQPATVRLDDRINPQGDGLTTAAIYCTDQGGVDVYAIDAQTGQGTLAIHLSAEELAKLPAFPVPNLKAASSGNIALWKLSTGELELIAAPTAAGKIYAFIWGGCPYTGDGYTP